MSCGGRAMRSELVSLRREKFGKWWIMSYYAQDDLPGGPDLPQVPLDRISDQPLGSGEIGWETTGATKYTILNDLKTAVEDGHLLFTTFASLRKCEASRTAMPTTWAAPAKGSDLLIGCAIAWAMRKHAKAKEVSQEYVQVPYERPDLN